MSTTHTPAAATTTDLPWFGGPLRLDWPVRYIRSLRTAHRMADTLGGTVIVAAAGRHLVARRAPTKGPFRAFQVWGAAGTYAMAEG